MIGDGKLISRKNQRMLCQQQAYFIGPSGLTQPQRKKLLFLLKTGHEWQSLDYASASDMKKPKEERTVYRFIEYTDTLRDKEEGLSYQIRHFFIYSSNKDQKDKKQRGKYIQKGVEELERLKGLVNKYDYKTEEAIREVRYRAL